VARLAQRRLIVLIVLVCQVATAANLAMAHTRTVGNLSSVHAHCAEQLQPSASLDSHQASTPGTDHTRHTGSCGCGCQCACAQATALARALELFSTTTHLPVTVPYRTMDVPQVATALFRPPI
jgi:hypothetical protein